MLRALPILLLFIWACGDAEDPSNPVRQRSSVVTHTVSGTVRGPDGNPICEWTPTPHSWGIFFIDTAPAADSLMASQNIIHCPTSTYTVSVPEGDGYLIRIRAGPIPTELPLAYFDPTRLDVHGDVTRDVRVTSRALLGYSRTNDGPLPGTFVTVSTGVTNWGEGHVGSAHSGSDGAWSHAFLQPRHTYNVSCGPALGYRGLTAPATFSFPNERARFDCNYRYSAANRWTHTATGLALTPWPGTFKWDFAHPQGLGRGGQYRTDPTAPLRHTYSNLYDGGFFLSAGSEIVSTFDSFCTTCGRLSGSTTDPQIAQAEGRKRITWRLNESSTSSGLSLVQTSYDGQGGDYVLYELAITNNGPAQVITYVGAFLDWDIYFLGRNTGATALDGRVAYVTAPGDTVLGSVFLGQHESRGTWFRNGAYPSEAQLLDMLKGVTQNTTSEPQDVTLVQSAGRLRIGPGRTKKMWLALVVGANVSELEANANAAAADYTARTGLPSF